MKNDKTVKPVEVFAGSAVEANMVKSLLENSHIGAFLKDEYIGTLSPWHAAPGGAGAVKVFVSNQDYEKAKIVIADFHSTRRK